MLREFLTCVFAKFFIGGKCDEGQKCDKILKELENIDDDTDDHGMHFVTTEETSLALEHGIKTFPALALFRNGEPVVYKGKGLDKLINQYLSSLNVIHMILQFNSHQMNKYRSLSITM